MTPAVILFGGFLVGLGTGAVAACDLLASVGRLPDARAASWAAWGVLRRLALFAAALAAGLRMGPGGWAPAAAGYVTGFFGLTLGRGLRHGR